MASVVGEPGAQQGASVGEQLGRLQRRVFGHFSEHLVSIVYGGMCAEMLVNRRFEMPGVVGRISAVAPAWEAAGGDGVRFGRGDGPFAMYPGRDCHHAQVVWFDAGREKGPAGIYQERITLDSDTRYAVVVRANVVGAVEALRVALHDDQGNIVTSRWLPVPGSARYDGDDLRHRYIDAHVFATELECTAAHERGSFSVTADPDPGHPASVWIHSVSLMPVDNVDGVHRGTSDAVRDLPAVVVKWPGGCFADNYDWRLGIGPRDLRHGAPDPAWGTWEDNDFGTDEFLRWCELTGTEPYLCVNHGTGTPELAAAWVEYCNGPVDSEWGARRAANGHPVPYGVRLWAIGNEVFGFWERGAAPPDVYAGAVKRFAAAMRAVDPTVELAVQGDAGAYTEALLPLVGEAIEWLSVHHYSAQGDPRADPAGYLAEARAFEPTLRRVVDMIRAAPAAGHVRIALDEWGWTPHADDPITAAFCACVLNGLSRLAPVVGLGGHCCVVNPMGVVARQGETVRRTLLYDVFQLYTRLHREGVHRLEGVTDDVDAVAYVDAEGLSIMAVNTTERELLLELDVTETSTVHRLGAVPELLGSTSVRLKPFEVVGVAACR